MSQDNKAALLDSLKIERAPIRRRRQMSPLLYAGIAAAVIALGAGGWYFWPDGAVPVKIVTAQAGSGAGGGGASLDASGYVVARRKATLSAKILGKVSEVNFEEGQKVKAGDIVARLDDSNYLAALHQAVAQERQAQAAFNNATPIYARYQNLKSQGAISTDAVENQRTVYDNARTAYDVARAATAFAASNENDTIVRAPFSGVVTVKVAQVGEVVAPQAAGGGDTRTGIVTIVDMDSLEVDVDVSENYIDRVLVGGAATIHLDAYPDWDIPGAVIAIIPTADQSKGTVSVRVAIKAHDARILPQMAARVSFMTPAEKSAAPTATRISVPLAAVQGAGRTGTIFVIKEDGLVEKRDVALGPHTAQTVTVLSGLTAGERLAASNLDKLQDGGKAREDQAGN
jgi:RND family efflux transporter MFP subunit